MKIVEVDSRRRISLGALAKYDMYQVVEDDQGVIRLEPVIALTLAEVNKLKEGK